MQFGLLSIAGRTVALAAVVTLAVGFASAQDPTPVAYSCIGDCDDSRDVTVDELLTGIGIALGNAEVSSCEAFDFNDDLEVSVEEIVGAVNRALSGCPPTPTPTNTDTPEPTLTLTASETPTDLPTPSSTATPEATATPTEPRVAFCDLPGSMRTTETGVEVVPGATVISPNMAFLQMPVGFCAHYYGRVAKARQIRFAPGGELFVAAPRKFTAAGGPIGVGSIFTLPDDDGDGFADSNLVFKDSLPAVQGLMFRPGFFYYQNLTRIMRMPYKMGDRVPSGESEEIANITGHSSDLHWPKAIDMADDGTIYVSNGGDQGDPCPVDKPYRGAILKLDGAVGGTLVTKGFRNPISLRCPRGRNLCYAIELGRDGSGPLGGREKIGLIRSGEDWGFPCCATKNRPFPDEGPSDCSGVTADIDTFEIGDTPFDIDFETGNWPAPWGNRAYIPLHGVFPSWFGARIVTIEMNPITGELMPASTLSGQPSGAMRDFVTGWADGTLSHGRPAAVAFSADGRLFLANDVSGDIFWFAPIGQ